MTDPRPMMTFRVNGREHEIQAHPSERLIDVIRDHLALTGTKEGCSTGHCGACTVLLDGRPIASCMTLAADAVGREITTIEGIAVDGKLHPLQQSFLDHGAVQCGFCTPGMVLSAKALLDANPRPTDEDIRRALVGNLCRCTGYQKIFDAIKAYASASRKPAKKAKKR